MAKSFIKIGGAREHNLKNLNLSIPRNQLVVVTGPSGSGKSSLVFDTIFAEGQRKYMESLSAYARQFLDQMRKPDIDFIEGLSPAIAIEQRVSAANPRSTIATTTEIFDYLRLLYTNVGTPHCPSSGDPISRQTTSDIIDELTRLPLGSRVILLAPVVDQEVGEFRDVLEKLAREGFVRVRIDGELLELGQRHKLDPKKPHQIDVVIDRIVVNEKIRSRLADSVETALKWGSGRLYSLHQLSDSSDSQAWTETLHSNRYYSFATGKSYDPVTLKHFSFNSPLGACPVCLGLGQKMVFNPDLIVPDHKISLANGAIAPWKFGGKKMLDYHQSLLTALTTHYNESLNKPFEALSSDFRQILFHGSGNTSLPLPLGPNQSLLNEPFQGILSLLNQALENTDSETTRKRLKSYLSPFPCDACGGLRLKPEILAITLNTSHQASLQKSQLQRPSFLPKNLQGASIMDLCHLSIEEADDFLANIILNNFQRKIAHDLVREIRSRLGFLRKVGLGYLSLNRESGSLSGGEAQRIRLATQIGAGLVGVLYILDEPSIGLHQRDNERLLQTLRELRDLGNSVLVVEHDEDTILTADHLIDMGPGAGTHGGEVVAEGSVSEVTHHPKSLTGKYLRKELTIPVPKRRHPPNPSRGWLEILGASENNLKNIDVRIPIGCFTCVTGVSGSGKSTLIDDILRRALFRIWFHSKESPGAHREIIGYDRFDKVIVIDQSPIGRTPRSNPATYTGIFQSVRDLFSKIPSARVRGFGASRFSFNNPGGRCEKCKGDGLIKIDMHFLPPVYITCETCQGKRYNRETLEITYKGLNIADILDLTIDDAVTFFRAVPGLADPCRTLAEVGLGYLKLGQPATTLSGGEAQRLKLAAELSRKSTGRTLYLMDEPTTGLHIHDVSKLLEVLFKLRDSGNTLVVIEHHLDVIKTADWILDLGPEGGSAGGQLVAQGTPEKIVEQPASHTGRFLKPLLSPLPPP